MTEDNLEERSVGDTPSPSSKLDTGPTDSETDEDGFLDMDGYLDEALSEPEDQTTLFARKELLDISYDITEGDEDRIVGRDEQAKTILNHFVEILRGNSGEHINVWGRTGTGKSLTIKTAGKHITNRAEEHNIRFAHVYVDCAEARTETAVLIQVGQELNKPAEEWPDEDDIEPVRIPHTGLGPKQYYERLWKIVNVLYDAVVITLDEIDKLRDDADQELLYAFSRAGESSKLDTTLRTIAISNDIHYAETLEARVESSYKPEDVVFPAYDATQLRKILSKRKDAFKPGVLTEDVIPLCAAFAAQNKGDARSAIDLMKRAGKKAEEEGDTTVGEDHVRAVQDTTAAATRIEEALRGSPFQAQLALASLAALTVTLPDEWFETSNIYKVYEKIAEAVDADVCKQRQLIRHFREHETYRMVSVNTTSGGKGTGVWSECRLEEDATVFLQIILEESRIQEIDSNELISWTVNKFGKNKNGRREPTNLDHFR